MKNKLIRKHQNAGKLNYNWSNNDDDLNTQYNRAWNFVHAYMHSPGFQERLKKHLNDMSYKNEGIYNDYNKDRDWSVRYPVDHNYKTNITTNVQKPDIIKMMNTVAQNSNQETQPTQEQAPLYVKQGGIIKAQNAIPYGFRIPYRANHLSFDNTPRIGTYTMPFPNKNLSKTSWLDLYSNEEEKRNGVTRTIETSFTSGPEIPYAYDPEYGYPKLNIEVKDTTYTSNQYPLLTQKQLKKKFNQQK